MPDNAPLRKHIMNELQPVDSGSVAGLLQAAQQNSNMLNTPRQAQDLIDISKAIVEDNRLHLKNPPALRIAVVAEALQYLNQGGLNTAIGNAEKEKTESTSDVDRLYIQANLERLQNIKQEVTKLRRARRLAPKTKSMGKEVKPPPVQPKDFIKSRLTGVTGIVIGEGTVGSGKNAVPAWRINRGGGRESLILKDDAILVNRKGFPASVVKELGKTVQTERGLLQDKRLKARTTTDRQKWMANRNRLDFEGIDTPPKTRRRNNPFPRRRGL